MASSTSSLSIGEQRDAYSSTVRQNRTAAGRRLRDGVAAGWSRKHGRREFLTAAGDRVEGADAFTFAHNEAQARAAAQAEAESVAAWRAAAEDTSGAATTAPASLVALSCWMPERGAAAYAAPGGTARISSLQPWQLDTLTRDGFAALRGANLLLVQPTSSGKTLVAELVALHTVLVRRCCVIFLAPYVSLCAEKTQWLRNLWSPMGLVVRGYYGMRGGHSLAGVDVAVATPERALSLLQHTWAEADASIGLVIADEVHLVEERGRGFILEQVLLSCLTPARPRGTTSVSSHVSTLYATQGSIQVIAMSATVQNAAHVGVWLRAGTPDAVITRPVPLKFVLIINDTFVEVSSHPAMVAASVAARVPAVLPFAVQPTAVPSTLTGDGIFAMSCILADAAATRKRVLIFVCARQQTVLLAKRLAEGLQKHFPSLRSRIPEQDLAACQQVLDDMQLLPDVMPDAHHLLQHGIAVHHAGLTVEERAVYERAFRTGAVHCLVATSTLATGVNLPAHAVIIRDTDEYNGATRVRMSSTRFHQMAGRCGRLNHASAGTVYVCASEKAPAGRSASAPAKPPTSSTVHPVSVCAALPAPLAHPGPDVVSATSLICSQPEPVRSSLTPLLQGSISPDARVARVSGAALRVEMQRYLLDAIAIRVLASDVDEALHTLLRPALVYHDCVSDVARGALLHAARAAIDELAASGLILRRDGDVCLTSTGKALQHAGLPTSIMNTLQQELATLLTSGGHDRCDDVHYLYVALGAADSSLFRATDVGTRIVDVFMRCSSPTRELYEHLRDAGGVRVSDSRGSRVAIEEATARRLAYAVVLNDFMSGSTLAGMEEHDAAAAPHEASASAEHRRTPMLAQQLRDCLFAPSFSTSPAGELQALQAQTAIAAGKVAAFADGLDANVLSSIFMDLASRCEYGVLPDMLPLMLLPTMNAARARCLYRAGYVSLAALAHEDASRIAAALQDGFQLVASDAARPARSVTGRPEVVKLAMAVATRLRAEAQAELLRQGGYPDNEATI